MMFAFLQFLWRGYGAANFIYSTAGSLQGYDQGLLAAEPLAAFSWFLVLMPLIIVLLSTKKHALAHTYQDVGEEVFFFFYFF